MKKASLAVLATISGFVYVTSGGNISVAFAKNNTSEVAISSKEAAIIKSLMEEIATAAQSGDEQLVSRLLASAIKSNPKIASKIVESFVASQDQSATGSSASNINVSAILNNVVVNLQNQKGSEALVAAVLSSYTPAAGNGNNQQSNNGNNGNNGNANGEKPNLPPTLPPTGQLGSDKNNSPNGLPAENPHQTSPN